MDDKELQEIKTFWFDENGADDLLPDEFKDLALQEVEDLIAAYEACQRQLAASIKSPWNAICNWIKGQPGCPEDAEFHVTVFSTFNGLAVDVLSDTLARETYEPDTNSADPGWNQYQLITTTELFDLRAQLAEMKELYDITEEGRSSFMDQLVEAQQTIRMACSDLPDKKYDAETTLEGYMTRHNLEEW